MSEVKRVDDKLENHQQKKQVWSKLIDGVNVTIKFGENVFRKHFVLPTRDGRVQQTAEAKIASKAEKRFKRTKEWVDQTEDHKTADGLQGRYGSFGTKTNTIVDIHQLDLDSVLVDLGRAFKGNNSIGNEAAHTTVEFSRKCVMDTFAGFGEGNRIDVQLGEYRTTMSLCVKKVGGGHTYEVVSGPH